MKTKMRRVLVPIDGSAFSLQVLPHITRLLPPEQTELVLLRVEQEPTLVELGAPGDPELTIYADQQAASLEANYHTEQFPLVEKLEKAGFSVVLAMRYGDPAGEIERYLAEEGADLVAMTTHGRTGLDRMVFGSVAQHLLRHVRTPVLLFRPLATSQPLTMPLLAAEPASLAA